MTGRSRYAWRFLACLGIVFTPEAASRAALAETPPPARWVGGDAALYVEVPKPGAILDVILGDRVQAILKTSADYDKALNGEQYRQFFAVVDLIAGQLGTTREKALRDLTGGGAVLAVEGDKADRVVLIVTPTDADFLNRAHAKLVELARKDAADKGNPDPFKESKYREVTVFSVGPQEAHAIIAGRLVITNGEATLKAAIDRAKDGKGPTIADNADWKARRGEAGVGVSAFAFARLDRLRAIDPKKYGGGDMKDPGPLLLLGPWVEALRRGSWAAAGLTWNDDRLDLALTVAPPSGGTSKALKTYQPPQGAGAAPLVLPPRTIASLSLWRDWSAVWDVRSEIFPPEFVQELSKLDTTAGMFFGGRDFGTGVLGSLRPDWRLVVARQEEKDLNPVPDVKLPAFALLIGVKPDDEEFAQRLKTAFQSFIGLANLGAAQEKAPPLELGSETVDGVTIATSRYVALKSKKPATGKEPVHSRHNFSPSSAQVGDTFVLSSTVGLARDLVRALKAPAAVANKATLAGEADGEELAKVLDANRERLVLQNMLEKGNDKAKAGTEVGFLSALVRYLGRATLSVKDGDDVVRARAEFRLGGK